MFYSKDIIRIEGVVLNVRFLRFLW